MTMFIGIRGESEFQKLIMVREFKCSKDPLALALAHIFTEPLMTALPELSLRDDRTLSNKKYCQAFLEKMVLLGNLLTATEVARRQAPIRH